MSAVSAPVKPAPLKFNARIRDSHDAHLDHRWRTRCAPTTVSQPLIEGSILAVVVVWLFLRSWRAHADIALAIPPRRATFAFMQWMNFTLNQITLLAAVAVAGVLGGRRIVSEIENIVRHMRMGKTAIKASLSAADEIARSGGHLVHHHRVFLPVSFMSGITDIFSPVWIDVASRCSSRCGARLITRCSRLLAESDSLAVDPRDGTS